MKQRSTRFAALAAATALGLALLTGCPAENKDTGSAASPGAETTTTAASPATTTTTTTTTTAATGSVAEGKAIYAARCQACHGADGAGGMGMKLVGVAAKGDALIRETILKGRPDKGMPAFDGQLKPTEVDAVVAYVKSL